MSLSSLIVQREIATIREVEEALARQVLYGGDLITNLLEVCHVDEASLVPVVAEGLGLPAAPTGELPKAEPEAARLVAPEIAALRSLAPLSVDRHGLVVAVAEPLSPDAEQELGFALALPIEQQIAPLFRIRQALARDYGVPLERRFARLLARLLEGRSTRSSSLPPMRNASDVRAPPRPPSVPPIQLTGYEAPRISARPSSPGARPPKTLVRSTEAPPARALARRRGPLTLEKARAELEAAGERDTIFDLLFEFARQYFDYTAFFVVRGETAEGRDAFGEGAPRDTVARIAAPLDQPGLLASALASKALVRGAPSSAVDAVLASDMGRPGDTECVVLPVVVRSRVVALLLGDGGQAGIAQDRLFEVERIVIASVAAFERIIVRRKLKRSAAPPPPPEPTASRPSVEELAPPIRELMDEAISRAASGEPPSPPRVPRVRSDGPPPPENLLSVRKPSGPPIPREEPDSSSRWLAAPPKAETRPSSPAAKARTSSQRRREAPPLEFGASPVPASMFGGEAFAVDDVERGLLAEIEGRAPAASAPAASAPAAPPAASASTSPRAESPPPMPAAKPIPPTDVSPVAMIPADGARRREVAPIAIVGEVAAPKTERDAPAASAPPTLPEAAAVAKPMPASEQQVSIPAHKPPSARAGAEDGLPSVIVDVAGEYAGLVQRAIEGGDEGAEAELVRAGTPAMPAIMARFPGPIVVERDRLTARRLPRVGECGPVLRVIAGQRRAALPFVLPYLSSADTDIRLWATYLITELAYADAVEPALARVFDDDERVRRVACAAARALADAHPARVVEILGRVANEPEEPTGRRVLAVEALGESREPLAVAVLIPLFESGSADLEEAARAALVTITRQDFGTDSARWQSWWSQNEGRHRLEWLIDSLMHDQAALRAAAGEELKAITKEYFGYYDDLPKRERERAQSRYREWWTNIGRVRFSRTSRT